MSSTSETGHAKNAANFKSMIAFVNAYGATYNPSNGEIKTAALDTKLTDANAAMSAVIAAKPAYINAVNARQILFDPLPALIRRVVGAVESSGTSAKFVSDVKTITRKLLGTRATPKLTDDPATPEDESAKSISAVQLSFDKKVENMESLIKLLSSEPLYIPNEADLTTASLTTLHTNMDNTNTQVQNAIPSLSNARIARSKVLYEEKNGMLTLATLVKAYVKSIFGVSSPQFKQLSALQFKKFK